jgi:hypothetical protein
MDLPYLLSLTSEILLHNNVHDIHGIMICHAISTSKTKGFRFDRTAFVVYLCAR